MLEIKNVKRIYKPKKGVPVVALDDVSLKFPDRGMVFLLGKSGSGKSTLLNVLGGLDKYDEGEIIIKGKSSKAFSQGDFDSYRNTYLGFIFQEYNILNEFTVGANIALALELQGKKATNDAVNGILEEVDLVGYGQRKPSELSGGQKQRVAIARALVKSPEIIMADEPTGALDSNTGLQVFETLKKLSKDKLVLVVTHDREFAELYGDRVIELKDGKVISDIEKFKAESHKRNDAVNIIDNKIIQIKKGYELTQEDLKFINKYIAEQDAIISIDNRANADLRKFARIDSDGNREAFKDTDESSIVISDDKKFKLIKSKLPFKNSLKIGASSLKNKPFRLFITILLSMVAFAMFGLADTMGSYNKYTTTRTSIVDSKINALTFEKTKVVKIEGRNYEEKISRKSSEEDIALLKQKTGLNFDKVYLPEGVYNFSFEPYLKERENSISYYINSLYGFFEINADKLQELGFSYTGALPKKNTEIAISQYTYSHFETYGYKYETVSKDAKDITGEAAFLALKPKIKINDVELEITAIIDTEFEYEHFASLNEPDINSLIGYMLMGELTDTVKYGYHGLIFVADNYIDTQLSSKTESIGINLASGRYGHYGINSNNPNSYGSYDNSLYTNASKLYSIKDLSTSGYKKYFIEGKTTLSSNEIMLTAYEYARLIEYRLNYLSDYDYEVLEQLAKDSAPEWYYQYAFGYKYFEYFLNDFIKDLLEEDSKYFDAMFRDGGKEQEEIDSWDIEYKKLIVNNYLESHEDDDTYCKSYNQLMLEYNEIYGESVSDYQKIILTAAVEDGTILASNSLVPSKFYLSVYNELTRYSNYEDAVNIVGIILPDDGESNIIVLDDIMYANMDIGDVGDYVYLITKMPTDIAVLNNIIKFSYDYKEDGIIYNMKNGVMTTLTMINELIEMLAKVFLYIGIGFAVFAALMLMNYIATSISYKRREIGILRAVGARSSDVFGIFFNESLIIALINFVLATIATFAVVIFLNTMLRTEYNLTITLLNFGIRQIMLMLGISVVVAFVSSFLPVYKVAIQKPIDAIKK